MNLRCVGTHIRDESNRVVLLRGVNLGGSTKVPYRPNGATWNSDLQAFYNYQQVSFVGRPFPLVEADEHFCRLKEWGFTFLRFLVTWEAIEHEGPGIYDMEYIDYVHSILAKAHEHGISVFIDPHQDIWCRWTGGDGAPAWTLEAIGMDITHIHASGAAIVEQVHGYPIPPLIWPTNYFKLGVSTMFTLFFGGADFAPKTLVNGKNIQHYLQEHYIGALSELARHLQDLPNVVGYGTMNEPFQGYIGQADLHAYPWNLRYGFCPSPFQSMTAGAGLPTPANFYEWRFLGFHCTKVTPMNPNRISVWKPGVPCVWEANGVWRRGEGEGEKAQLLRPSHFSVVDGRPVDFYADYMAPFVARFAAALRAVAPTALVSAEGSPLCSRPTFQWLQWKNPSVAPRNVVFADHWYDGLVLFTKAFRSWLYLDTETNRLYLGPYACQRGRQESAARIARRAAVNQMPALVGECGVVFDMEGKRAYRTGDFRMQERALDSLCACLERVPASFTIWNYTSDNSNQYGDHWNGEDFSLFCVDQKGMQVSQSQSQQPPPHPPQLYDGGRALKAALRPYASRVAGVPTRQHFDMNTKVYQFAFTDDPTVAAGVPTEFYVPRYQYPQGYQYQLSDGYAVVDLPAQRLLYYHTSPKKEHTVLLWDPKRGGRNRQQRRVQRLVVLAVEVATAAAVLWVGLHWLTTAAARPQVN